MDDGTSHGRLLCGAKTKRGTLCNRYPVPGRNRCIYHGGRTPVSGPTHPCWKHGRYSKAMPSALGEKYAEALDDPELGSLREELAVLQAMIGERIERIGKSCSNDFWAELVKSSTQLLTAHRAGNNDAFEKTFRRQQELIAQGGELGSLLTEIADLVETKSRVAAREWRRIVDLQQVLTIQSALSLVQALIVAVKKHVDDSGTVRAIAAEFTQITGDRGNNDRPDDGG